MDYPKKADLEALAAGDEVIVRTRTNSFRYATEYQCRVVDRVTKTQIVVGDARYRKSDGREKAQGWDKAQLLIATPGNRAELQEAHAYEADQKLRRDLIFTIRDHFKHHHDRITLPTDALRQIAALIDEDSAE